MLKASTGSSRSTACSASPTYGVVEAAGCFYLPPVQMRGQAKSFSRETCAHGPGQFIIVDRWNAGRKRKCGQDQRLGGLKSTTMVFSTSMA
jgi:hypothetical protein